MPTYCEADLAFTEGLIGLGMGSSEDLEGCQPSGNLQRGKANPVPRCVSGDDGGVSARSEALDVGEVPSIEVNVAGGLVDAAPSCRGGETVGEDGKSGSELSCGLIQIVSRERLRGS